MSDAVRFGLVGYGFGGRVFHAPLLTSAANVEFAGVLTNNAERREQVLADHPGATTFGSLAEMVAAGVEAVTVSTPAATHAELAEEALSLGLATVVDKPFTMDLESAKSVVAAAREGGVLLSVYQNRRYDSDFRTVRRLIDDGQLGAIRRFESRFERWAPDRKPGAAGGGTLLDFGSHLVDQALVLNGPATRVYAEMRGAGELDDDMFIALHHVNGVESHLWGSWRQAAPGPRFRVTGTTGTYIVDGISSMDGQEAVLKSGRSPAKLGDRWGVEPEHAWGRLYRGATGATIESSRGRWDLYYPAFAAAVRGEGPVPVDPTDTLRAMAVLDAARVSARTGASVTL